MQCILVKSDEFENSFPVLYPVYVAARSLRSLRRKNLAVVVHVQTTEKLVISSCIFAEDGKKNVLRIMTRVHICSCAH